MASARWCSVTVAAGPNRTYCLYRWGLGTPVRQPDLRAVLQWQQDMAPLHCFLLGASSKLESVPRGNIFRRDQKDFENPNYFPPVPGCLLVY